MIIQVKKKLTTIFFTSLVLLISAIMCITYLFIDYNIRKTSLAHVQLNFEVEFLPHYQRGDINTLEKIIEDELFQVINKSGEIVLSVKTPVKYNPDVNMILHREVLVENEIKYEFVKHEGDKFLLYFIPLDDGNVCRIVCPMTARYAIKNEFLDTMLLSLPFLLCASFFLTRFFVRESLKPIHRVFTFQETFSSNITHELNSPLASIKGILEVTLRKKRTVPEYHECIRSMLKSINRIIKLLNNLYLLSIADQKNLPLAVKRLNMAKLISEAVEIYEPIFYSKQIAFDMELERDSYCFGDQSLLSRAIENIVDNATKYTPEKGFINLRTCKNGGQYIIKVSNTCVGLVETDLKNLYRPFCRLQNTTCNYTKGAGLGLFIVKFIVESHHGKIDAQLEENIITITVSLPV